MEGLFVRFQCGFDVDLPTLGPAIMRRPSLFDCVANVDLWTVSKAFVASDGDIRVVDYGIKQEIEFNCTMGRDLAISAYYISFIKMIFD